jgi:hypothetical protein
VMLVDLPETGTVVTHPVPVLPRLRR